MPRNTLTKGVWAPEDYPAPPVAALYNKTMGGVDQLDKAVALYKIHRKTQKWTHALSGYCCVLALLHVDTFIFF